MKSEKLKRNFWLSAEIECMLNLIKEFKAGQGSASHTTTNYTFTLIANKMKKRGFPNKSPTQIRRKWFQMKSAYLCYKKGNVERLFLIPEKFRNDIAQFVDSGSKSGRVRPVASAPVTKEPPAPAPASPAPPVKVRQKVQQEIADIKPVQKELSTLDKFMAQIRKNNALLNDEFMKMQESLMQYEHKCQSMRDDKIIKFLSG